MGWPWSLSFLRRRQRSLRGTTGGSRLRTLRGRGDLRRADFRRHLKSERLDSGGLIVLLGFLDLDFLEITRALERGNEIGDGVDRGGRTLERQIISLACHAGQPEVFRARHGASDFVE